MRFPGGEKLATNYEVGIPSPALATMWHHKDPNMSSYRSTGPSGTVLGTGVDYHDWDKIETDGDGKSVGLSAPVYFPEHSNELYTSGWSFGSLNTGQYMAHVVDGIHVPAEFMGNRVGNRHGSLNLDLLFFSAQASRIRFIDYSVRYIDDDVLKEIHYGSDFDLVWAMAQELRETFVRNFAVNDSWAINWSMIPRAESSEIVFANDRKKLPMAKPPSRERMSKCLKQFGKNVELKGAVAKDGDVYTAIIQVDGKEFTIRTNFTQYNSHDLGKFAAAANGQKYTNQQESGWTSANNPTFNHIASDVVLANQRGEFNGVAFMALFYHEMGNAIAGKIYQDAYAKALSDKTGTDKLKDPFNLPISPTDQGDRDSGTRFERCLYGGIVGLRDGRVGNSRNW